MSSNYKAFGVVFIDVNRSTLYFLGLPHTVLWIICTTGESKRSSVEGSHQALEYQGWAIHQFCCCFLSEKFVTLIGNNKKNRSQLSDCSLSEGENPEKCNHLQFISISTCFYIPERQKYPKGREQASERKKCLGKCQKNALWIWN